MANGLDPTEEYDGSIIVRTFDDDGSREREKCASFKEAIETVKELRHSHDVVEIVDKDNEAVFNSVDMNIEDWEVEWKHAKRRLSVDVEERECPYDNVACFADDLCVQCKIDKVQNQV
ncbi:hypothetical protein HWV07_08765 [Natronomonas salina]|uniref:hypothetical protein n=1 Tax=Natronomonas salina TaxID=1710540 RepID=UPI0015B5C42E|nr:hypothetical protein [Natronomonas salina]QLD89116.1 hypothetical protein HWV07_08765 [Natronomonas salina]